jgi:excisionase family DNA binding protein
MPAAVSKFHRVDEVADRLGVIPDTVRRLIASGELRAVRLGRRMLRVDPEDFERFLRERRTAENA